MSEVFLFALPIGWNRDEVSGRVVNDVAKNFDLILNGLSTDEYRIRRQGRDIFGPEDLSGIRVFQSQLYWALFGLYCDFGYGAGVHKSIAVGYLDYLMISEAMVEAPEEVGRQCSESYIAKMVVSNDYLGFGMPYKQRRQDLKEAA